MKDEGKPLAFPYILPPSSFILPTPSPRMKERLREKLSLSSKLRLKRALFAPVGWALRLAARAYNFAERVGESAAANGLDLRRAFDVKQRPGAPHAQPWGASDFLFLARAAAGEGREGSDPVRPVTTSVIIPV